LDGRSTGAAEFERVVAVELNAILDKACHEWRHCLVIIRLTAAKIIRDVMESGTE
jgi:hypothetical protein